MPEFWSHEAPIVRGHFTTIADWWGQAYVEFEGKMLGPKEFVKFLNLPQISGEMITLVLDIPPGDADIELATAARRTTPEEAAEAFR